MDDQGPIDEKYIFDLGTTGGKDITSTRVDKQYSLEMDAYVSEKSSVNHDLIPEEPPYHFEPPDELSKEILEAGMEKSKVNKPRRVVLRAQIMLDEGT